MIAQEMINMASKQSLALLVHFVRGWKFKWEAEVCCLQVTTEAAMKVAMQAAGAARTTVESQLSKVGFTSLTAGLASLASARQPLSQRVELLDNSIFLNDTYNQKVATESNSLNEFGPGEFMPDRSLCSPFLMRDCTV